MSSTTNVPQLVSVTGISDPVIRQAISAITEILQVREGNKGSPLDANATFRDLVNAGLAVDATGSYSPPANINGSAGISVYPAPSLDVDLSTPPNVEGFKASSSVESVFLTWTASTQKGHAYTEIYRSSAPAIPATPIGHATGIMYVDHTASGENYYWARHVSSAGKFGQFTTAEVKGTPVSDPASVITAMKDAGIAGVDGMPYYYVPTATTIASGQLAGTVIQAGTYISTAMIANAAITNAMIKNAEITGAKIANATINSAHIDELDADKIGFDVATGKIMAAAVIVGGDISGVEIHGSHIYAGGTATDPNIEMNDSGSLVAYSQSQITNRDYTTFADGEVSKSFWVPEFGYATSNALTQVETGQALSGEPVVLEKFYKNPPYVMVSPSNIPTFSPDFFDITQAQNAKQSITVNADVQRQSNDPNTLGYYTMVLTPKAELHVDSTTYILPKRDETHQVRYPANNDSSMVDAVGTPLGIGGIIYYSVPALDTGPYEGPAAMETIDIPALASAVSFTAYVRGYKHLDSSYSNWDGYRAATHTVTVLINNVIVSRKTISCKTYTVDKNGRLSGAPEFQEFPFTIDLSGINSAIVLGISIDTVYSQLVSDRGGMFPLASYGLPVGVRFIEYGKRSYKRSPITVDLKSAVVGLSGSLNYIAIGS